MKSTYILAIMSPDGRSVRQISVGRWCLKILYIFLFTVIVSALGGIGYGLFSKASHQAIEQKNANLKERVQFLQTKLDSEESTMDEIKRMADKVRSGLGIDAETEGALGQGGYGFGANPLEDSESSEAIVDTNSSSDSEVYPSEKPDSLSTRVAKAKAAIVPVYEYVVNEEKRLSETPSVLPIIAPENGEEKVYWFSSEYGPRTNPITRRREFHTGLDIVTKKNTPIIAAAHGIISYCGYHRLLGNMIRVKHPTAKMETVYGHMSKFADGMSLGKKVARGEVIGYVGTSGRSTGYHLHYGVWETDKEYKDWDSKEGSWINPVKSIFGHWPSQ
ncbi:MAG: M23 family metallopeptidase [Candidatus Poribacteria bacterium]|nr:M23 family metallopeptidase [Candidatus Poribacteria bacterium]